MKQLKPTSCDVIKGWDIFEWKDILLCDPTKPEDQSKFLIVSRFNRMGKVPQKMKACKYKGIACMEYFNLLYLCKTIGLVLFDLCVVDRRHRYTNVRCFICATSYKSNRNCIIPESVKTAGLFDNTVGNPDNEDPEVIVLPENISDVLEGKKQSL